MEHPLIDAVPSLEQLKSRFVCAAEFTDGLRDRLTDALTEDHREALVRMMNSLGIILQDMDDVLDDARCAEAVEPPDSPIA